VTRRLVVEADGGSRGNPGPAGYGALVADAQTGDVLAELHDSLGTTTNNVAEYSGLVAALRAAGDLAPGADVEVRMDSKLVVEQMSGRWRIKDPGLRELATSAQQAADRLGRITYTWVPRSNNKRADRLANQAMDAAQGKSDNASGQPGADRDGRGGRPEEPRTVGAGAETASAGRGWGQARGQATTTLLLRHGATPLSAERRFAGRGDIPLTDDGRRQAAAAAARLRERGGIDVIVTSPLRRARRTAEAVAEASGAPLVVDDDLAEADFGAWEGLSFAEASAKSPEEMTAWLASADAAPPGGESFADVARRVLRALDRLLEAYPERTVVLVSHVTPIKTLLCRALLAPPAALFRIHLDVASLSQVDWFADGPALVRSMNDTAHLR
jgi:ribonuclease H / adenosylcobalamin/alpha-ribazole phosphatase